MCLCLTSIVRNVCNELKFSMNTFPSKNGQRAIQFRASRHNGRKLVITNYGSRIMLVGFTSLFMLAFSSDEDGEYNKQAMETNTLL